jgi:hypothetical protein
MVVQRAPSRGFLLSYLLILRRLPPSLSLVGSSPSTPSRHFIIFINTISSFASLNQAGLTRRFWRPRADGGPLEQGIGAQSP